LFSCAPVQAAEGRKHVLGKQVRLEFLLLPHRSANASALTTTRELPEK
jgi:hypothetical protein